MMKEYNHKTINLPEITATTTDGVRLYETPEGNKYPSITTVLSVKNKKGLFEWRKRVGEEVANYVARKAANRGTAVHHMCEDYLNNMPLNYPDSWAKHKQKFLPYTLFKQLRESVLQKVNNIYSQECGLYSDKYKVAGRVDCIAEYNGVLSIIDFKTSIRLKKIEWIKDYFLQGCFYFMAYRELTGEMPEQVCILISVQDGSTQIFTLLKKDIIKYTNELKERISIYNGITSN